MNYVLYDFMDARGVNRIKTWTLGLQQESRIRLNRKFDLLEQYGEELPPKLLAGTDDRKIKKLRITGTKVPTLRVMVCKGPLDMNGEFTILQGAVEKDSKLDPPNAVSLAAQHREEIIDCDQRKHDNTNRCNNERRCQHEQVD